MNDKKWIVLGLVIFAGLFTFPFWYNLLVRPGTAAPMPEIVLTERAKTAQQCVMPTDFMRTEHMKLLDVWRLRMVREGVGEFVNPDGKVYAASLSNTCLDCHSNKAEFCDRCHDYVSTRPYCWDCHIDDPKGGR